MSEDQTPTSPAAELVAVVEDLVERQRQILGALVATTHPLKNDVQAVLLGMRGVVTKLRNGAAEAVPTTPTNPDLREQVAEAIGDPGAFVPRAKERGAGGQYESVPQWAARAVGSLVWPLVAEARAEADMHRRTRLRVERVLDEALGAEEKDGTGEGLAADVRLAITRRDEEIERLQAELNNVRSSTAVVIRAHELNNGALAAERDALSSLLRGMARRVSQKREEIRELAAHLPCGWCNGTGIAPEERFGRDADGAPQVDGDQPCPEGCRPPVSDQTPATPARAFSRCNWWMDTRQCTEDAVHDGLCARHRQESHDPATAPSSVQGDTTPGEGDQS